MSGQERNAPVIEKKGDSGKKEGAQGTEPTLTKSREDAFGSKADKLADTKPNTAGKALGDGFGVEGSPAKVVPAKDGSGKVADNGLPKVDVPRDLPKPVVDMKDMARLAKQFDWACNGGITGVGQDAGMIKNIIKGLNEDEFKAFNDIFTKEYGSKYAGKGETWDVMKQLEYEKSHWWPNNLSDRDFDFLKNSIELKKNEVPEQYRVSGWGLLKPGSEITPGKINNLKTADGTEYGVIVPKNADSRTPVIMAMHGAGLGDGKGVMADESGLQQYAEKLGAIVVLAYPKPQNFETLFGMTTAQGVGWNVPGRTDLPKEETDAYDDRKRMDNVRADLANRVKLEDRPVGIVGFSDGGRMGQVYAADRPGAVAGVVSLHGTWMKGDAEPTAGTPIRIVHSRGDQTLKWTGGPGSTGDLMDGSLTKGTNLDKSEPWRQPEVWAKANQCGDGEPTITQQGNTTISSYGNCKAGEVTVVMKDDKHNHALDDKLNDGSPTIQYWLGAPDLKDNDMLDSARWLKEQILKNKGA